MSRDSKEYSWYMTSGGAYEPIQTLDAIAPMNLIKSVIVPGTVQGYSTVTIIT